jgi:phenylpropionate dioxygenase-like ring-hydroxylating dioxygenase large terminal subunit
MSTTRERALLPPAERAARRYPFRPGPVFVTDAWYVAGWSKEITRAPWQRTILGQSIVFFRTEDGTPVALADRCPHRGFPLSQSRLEGDSIQCGYHGFTFDRTGRCTHIPSQVHVPAAFRARSYALAERWEWVWIWMGAPEDADESLIPDHAEAGLAGNDWLTEIAPDFHVKARYQLFNDNLLDLTHLTFLHETSIGRGLAGAKRSIDVNGRVVRVTRDTLDEEPTPLYATRLGIPGGRIDRRHASTFVAPSFHVIHITTKEAASALDGAAAKVYGEHKIVHAVTPETETTMRLFWAFSRSYNKTPQISEYLQRNLAEVVRQDVDALEAIEALIDDNAQGHDLSCAADEAALKGRQIVQALLDREREAHVTSEEHHEPWPSK